VIAGAGDDDGELPCLRGSWVTEHGLGAAGNIGREAGQQGAADPAEFARPIRILNRYFQNLKSLFNGAGQAAVLMFWKADRRAWCSRRWRRPQSGRRGRPVPAGRRRAVRLFAPEALMALTL
jgi:hypothetical protein